MKIAEKILELPPNAALFIWFLVFAGIALFIKYKKAIFAWGDAIYNRRKKIEEQERIIDDGYNKIQRYEGEIAKLQETAETLKEQLDDANTQIEEYDKTNHKHWEISQQYRDKYEDQIKRDEQRHDELFEMQKQLAETQKSLAQSIASFTELSTRRDAEMENLRIACKELLASEINKKYQRFLILGYIPADEADEWENAFRAYTGVKGNHSIEAKYNYIKAHLEVKVEESRPVLDIH